MKKTTKCLLTFAFLSCLTGVSMPSIRQVAQAIGTKNNAEIIKEANVVKEKENAKEQTCDLKLRGKSAFVMDFDTETPIYQKEELKHLPIASMCKIMTLLLAFDAINEGALSIDEEIVVSERAASMGGSQVFLEANAKYPVNELLKSIAVCSANDSCVAIAEKISGSEALFVDKMNEKAKSLGANDTLFANCTGLPKEPQYSCAKDVALMLKALLQYPDYFKYGNVWMDKFAHPKGRYTEISNTNKLVRFYEGCDGGKTGFTNQAGFCLAATAKRNGMRIISVVIGEENSKNRFEDVKTTFDYAFANYTLTPIVEASHTLETCGYVNGGKEKTVSVCPMRSSYVFTKRGEKADITMETRINTVKAPVKKGEIVGEIVVYKNNVAYDKIPLIAQNSVDKANYLDCLKDVAKGWNKRSSSHK